MKENMGDEEVVMSNSELSSNIQISIDSFLGEFLKNTRTCTHTHTCNPPGPDAAHTHTCYHTHTQVLPSEDDKRDVLALNPRRLSGNREAVRKYREKKKAHTAYLEEEVKKLRALNQHLMRKLQGNGVLEAEVLRLRGLLLDLQGKIDIELGVFPFQKQCDSTLSFKEGDCGVKSNGGLASRCENNVPCFHPHTGSSFFPSSVGGGGTLAIHSEGNDALSAEERAQNNLSVDGELMEFGRES